jgi:hypothetical protein
MNYNDSDYTRLAIDLHKNIRLDLDRLRLENSNWSETISKACYSIQSELVEYHKYQNFIDGAKISLLAYIAYQLSPYAA